MAEMQSQEKVQGMLYHRRVSVRLVTGAGGKDFEGLRIRFEVEKTNESTPNSAHISIYNMSDESRSMFEDTASRVIVSAGYKSNFGVVFSGNIANTKQKKKKQIVKTPIQHRFEGVDIVTEVEATDGGNKYKNIYTVRAFPPGSTYKEVIEALAKDFGSPVSIDLDAIPDGQFANGYSVGSETRHALDDLCKTHGLEWSFQNEIVQIISKDKTKQGEVLLTPMTGLIGSPTKTSKGAEFDSLLQPALSPACKVKLESKFVSGIYKIYKVTHTGDSHEGDFLSRCEATLI